MDAVGDDRPTTKAYSRGEKGSFLLSKKKKRTLSIVDVYPMSI